MLCDINSCSGYAACFNACPKGAISMVEDAEGFSRPQIDESACVHCGLCDKSCPVLNPVALNPPSPKALACWALDDSVRLDSTSGGAFSELALAVLREGGVVFASGCDENLYLRVRRIENESDLGSVRQSKYWQSDVGTSLREIKGALKEGRRVLFVGTPCQVAGARAYLGDLQNDPLLWTADLICGGAPSPGVFRKYLDYLRETLGRGIRSINMRDKTKSWEFPRTSVVLEDGSKRILREEKDWFKTGFYNRLFNRPCCDECPYANKTRVGDLTIGDYWGLGSLDPVSYPKKKGVSAVLCNTPRGEMAIEAIKERCFIEERKSDELVQRAMERPAKSNRRREAFFADLKKEPIRVVVKKYLRRNWKTRLRSAVASLLPASLCAKFLKKSR